MKLCPLDRFFKKLTLKIAMSGRGCRVGWQASVVGRHPRFTFWSTLLKKPVHNAVRHFSRFFVFFLLFFDVFIVSKGTL